jgi:hypothetical protein
MNVPITNDLLVLLTQDTLEVSDESKKDYKALVLFALQTEFKRIKEKVAVTERKRIINLMRKNSKFVNIISEEVGIKGNGYQGLALIKTIVIPPNINERLNRFMVLYGSINAGNTNSSIIDEGSAILDSLLKDKVIDKMKYKLLYYKMKNRLTQNQKEN